MDTKSWIEIIAVLSIPLGMCLMIYHRVKQKMGIGVRAIQFLTVAIVTPLILILALEGILERSAVGALIGAIIGYLLSNIGEYDKRKAAND